METSVQRRRAGNVRRWGLVLLISIAFLVVGTAALAPRVALPAEWVQPLLGGAGLPEDVAVAAHRVAWSGWDRLIVHQAEFTWAPAGQRGGGPRAGLQGEAARMEIQVVPSDLLPWLTPPQARHVRLEGVRLAAAQGLPSLGGLLDVLVGAGPLEVGQADLRLAEGEVAFKAGEVAGLWGQGSVEGRWLQGEVEATVRLQTGGIAPLAALAGLRVDPAAVEGPVEVELRVEGPPEAPRTSWQLEAPSVRWAGAPWAPGPYTLEGVSARGRWSPGGGWEIEAGRARIRPPGGGDPRTVDVAGTVGAAGELALAVAVDGLQIPEDIPALARWGIGGRIRFHGTLAGDTASPRLQGEVEMGPGRLWHQPVDRVEAEIALTPRGLTVDGSRVEQGDSIYRLAGEVAFPTAGDQGAGGPAGGALDLTLASEAGRAETLLDALGWRHIPLSGTVDGQLRFRGPFGSLESEGTLVLSAGSGWSQPFDEISGTYRWDRERLHLLDGVFRLGGGRGGFSGTVDAGGGLDLEVDAAGLPLEAMEAVRRASRELVSGRVDFRGHVAGTLQQPSWAGQVEGRRLRIGRLDFEQGAGELSLAGGAWEVRDLALERPSGARYTASGWVDASPGLPTLVHLLVDVDGEALEDALSLMGIGLGYPLVSGQVAGRALLVGELAQPDGEVSLDVTDAYLAGRPTGLSVEMEVAGGQVRVKGLRLDPPDRQQQG